MALLQNPYKCADRFEKVFSSIKIPRMFSSFTFEKFIFGKCFFWEIHFWLMHCREIHFWEINFWENVFLGYSFMGSSFLGNTFIEFSFHLGFSFEKQSVPIEYTSIFISINLSNFIYITQTTYPASVWL